MKPYMIMQLGMECIADFDSLTDARRYITDKLPNGDYYLVRLIASPHVERTTVERVAVNYNTTTKRARKAAQ